MVTARVSETWEVMATSLFFRNLRSPGHFSSFRNLKAPKNMFLASFGNLRTLKFPKPENLWSLLLLPKPEKWWSLLLTILFQNLEINETYNHYEKILLIDHNVVLTCWKRWAILFSITWLKSFYCCSCYRNSRNLWSSIYTHVQMSVFWTCLYRGYVVG